MSKKIIYSTVIYQCPEFEVFIDDYLKSVFTQTDHDFELMLVVDNADRQQVRSKVDEQNIIDIPVHIFYGEKHSSPILLRLTLIEKAYDLEADILIFSDFDESVAPNRIEEVRNKINGYDFAFNDFYIVDNKLNKVDEDSFFQTRRIPEAVNDWQQIKSCNYIGFGSLAINLASFNYRNFDVPGNIKALDWFLASKVLMEGGKGVKLDCTYANYRQHDNSFVGFDFKLTERKLIQGINIKKSHYDYFRKYNSNYEELYREILELESYIKEVGKEKYIEIVNSKFDTTKFTWWENIKTKKEIANVI